MEAVLIAFGVGAGGGNGNADGTGSGGGAFAAFSFGGLASLVTTVADAFTGAPALASRDV